MDKDWMVLLQQQTWLDQVIKTNQTAERFGLVLTEQDARLILEKRKASLQEQKRVEFGEGITAKIIYEFCDSDFIDQNNYVETIIPFFFLIMCTLKEQFELICFGDLEYLESTCLSLFSQAIRRGYDGYKGSDGIFPLRKPLPV